MEELLRQFVKNEQGQDLVEYTLILPFIALASAALFSKVGGSSVTIWKGASNYLSNAVVSSS